MRKWLLLTLMFCVVSQVFCQAGLQRDTSNIKGRLFNQASLNELKKQRAFQYEKIQEPPQSLWDRFWSWFWWQISQFLTTTQGKTTMWTVFIIFGAGMIVFFVLKLNGMNRDGLFGRSGGKGQRYTIDTDDIHSISFDEAISEAINEKNYRLATRLLYLQLLKKLSDNNHINWQINKTNTDYLLEVMQKTWYAIFKNLTDRFEYTWYGKTYIDEESFKQLHIQFQQFNNQLK